MSNSPYPYKRLHATRYSFLSNGRRPIMKIVEFTPTKIKNIYNLGFGDLLANGKIDDIINSNNGDIIQVLSTVVHIIKDFTLNNGKIKVVFTGSTPERTALYQRILKTYYSSFNKEFRITALVRSESKLEEVTFNPNHNKYYAAFFVKRII